MCAKPPCFYRKKRQQFLLLMQMLKLRAVFCNLNPGNCAQTAIKSVLGNHTFYLCNSLACFPPQQFCTRLSIKADSTKQICAAAIIQNPGTSPCCTGCNTI